MKNKKILKAERAFTMAQIGLICSHIGALSTIFVALGMNYSGASTSQILTTMGIGVGLGIASLAGNAILDNAETNYMKRHANDPCDKEDDVWLDPEM